MKYDKQIILLILFLSATGSFFPLPGQSQNRSTTKLQFIESNRIVAGAERTELYFNALRGKSIGLICNHTSMVGKTHLVDTLIRSGFSVKVIFSPEHGFRGENENGAEISDGTDPVTGVKIISLYGKKKQPLPEELAGIDILIFDIQDVGTRFYTYISTLSLIMESAAKLNIPVIVTDRPNPNGFYVDGPVLDTAFRSFVGMHPVPIVYGMTVGEYALMVNGEGWFGDKKCDLTVIPLSGYDHNMLVKLKIKPSPNLPTWQSVYLYPSLCLFEGTFISVGRGTTTPFQVIGHPYFMAGSFDFKPVSIPGVSEHPLYEGKVCYGSNVTGFAENYKQNQNHFTLVYLLLYHKVFSDSADFFNSYFTKLSGNDQLKKDIISGLSEPEIRKSWENDLSAFMLIRKKYLLYPDFN
jgi:uncharacterized protein YbbC (DUF1343 family)